MCELSVLLTAYTSAVEVADAGAELLTDVSQKEECSIIHVLDERKIV